MESSADGNDQIHIEQLEVFARVGVTDAERAKLQRLTLTIDAWPVEQFDNLQDDITRATNYSALSVTAREFVAERTDRLIETLVCGLANQLLQTFALRKVRLELRKFVLPEAKHVAVIVTRSVVQS